MSRVLANYDSLPFSVLTEDSLLVVPTQDGLTAYDEAGTVQWFVEDASSATVGVGGLLYASNGFAALAIDAATGSIEWSTPLSLTVPLVAAPLFSEAGVVVFLGEGDYQALDAATGAELSTGLARNAVGVALSPEGSIYVAYPDQVRAFDATTGAENLGYTTAGTISSLLVSPTGMVYVEDGGNRLTVLEPETLTSSWQLDATASLSPVSATGEFLYVGDGTTLLAFEEVGGFEFWSTTLPSEIRSAPIRVGDVVLVGQDNGLLALDASGGSVLWETPLDMLQGPLTSSEDGTLAYALAGDWGGPTTLHVVDMETGTILFEYDYDALGYFARDGRAGSLLLEGEAGLRVLSKDPGAVRAENLACEPCSTGCSADAAVGQCRSDGAGWTTIEQCLEDEMCQAGECVECTPNQARQCDGNDIHWVDSCGRQGDLIETCEGGLACVAGACAQVCSLTNCSSGGFTYGCGSGSSSSHTQYQYDVAGHLTGATFDVTYSNGHRVSCVLRGGSLSTGTCSDDTGSSCAW